MNIDIASLNFDVSKLEKSALDARLRIDELTKTIGETRKETKSAVQDVDRLTAANLELAEAGEESGEEYKANKKQIEELNKVIVKNTNDIIKNESEKRNLNKVQRDINKTLDLSTKQQRDANLIIEQSNEILQKNFETQQEARDVGASLISLRQQLNPQIEEEAELMQKLSERINQANEFQALYNSENEKRVKGIGQYREQVTQAIKDTLGFNTAQNSTTKGMVGFKDGITGAIGGIGGLSKATMTFTAIPLITVVTLLVKGFQFLYEKFTETQEGMDAITKITRPLMAIFDSLIGIAQEVGTTLVNMATSPKKAFQDLIDFIKNNVENRLKSFIVIMEAIENRDFKGAVNGFLQMGTGVENLIDKTNDAINKTSEFFSNAYQAGLKIDELQKEIEKSEANIAVLRAENTVEMRKQELIAKDTSKSAAERTEAIRRQTELTRQLVDEEKRILDLRIQSEEISQSFNDTSRKDTEALNKLIAERTNLEKNYSDTAQRNLGVEKQLRAEAAAQAKEIHKARMTEIMERHKSELELFILRNEGMQDSLNEELKFYEDVQKKKLIILEQSLKSGAITQLQFDTESEKLRIEGNRKEAEVVSFYAGQKLNEEILNLQTLQKERKRFSDESFEDEKLRLENIKNLRVKDAQDRLAAEVITRHEFNELMLNIETENLTAQSEIRKTFDEQLKEDRKLSRLLEQEEILLGIEDQFLREQELLNQKYENERILLEEQKENGLISEDNYLKSLSLMQKKQADEQMKLDELVADNKVDLMSSAFGNISKILGKNSTEGKFFASAQAFVDTYAAANKAMAAYPPPFSYIAAGAAIAGGLSNVAQINKVKTHKYSGGYTGDGGMFNRTGYTHGREIVFSQQDVLAAGGVDAVERLRPTSSQFKGLPTGVQGNDDDDLWIKIGEILGREVRLGSESGTSSGMTDRIENINVRRDAIF